MAGRIKGITVEIEGNTTKLQKALSGVDSSLKHTQSALNDVNKLLKLNPESTELLTQKQGYLKDAIEQTKERLETLKTASEQAAQSAGDYDAWREKYEPIQGEIEETKARLKELKASAEEAERQLEAGEISQDQYDAIQGEIRETRKHLKDLQADAKAVSDEFGNPISPEEFNSLQREIVATEGRLESFQSELDGMNTDGLTEEMEEAGDSMEEAGGKASAFGDMLMAKLAGDGIIEGVKRLGKALKDLLDDTVAYADTVDKMSQKMGMSAESYQEWDSVMRHCGSSMESLKSSMKTLSSAAETGKAAFEELGISQEAIARMSQEELFAATIAALQNVEDTTRRTYLAGQTLGRGATELGALLNMSADEVEAMKARIHELGGVMDDEAIGEMVEYKDAVQDLGDAWGGLARGTVRDLAPMLTEIATALGDVVGLMNQLGIGLDDVLIPPLAAAASGFAGIRREIGGTVKETEGLSGTSEALAEAAETAEAAYEGMSQAVTDAMAETDEYSRKIAELVSGGFLPLAEGAEMLGISVDDLRHKMTTYEQEANEASDVTGALTKAQKAAIDAAEEQAEAEEAAAEAFEDMVETLEGMPGVLSAAGYSATEMARTLTEAGITADEFAAAVETDRDRIVNSFQEISREGQLTGQQMVDVLTGNLEARREWADNLETLWWQAYAAQDQAAMAMISYMSDHEDEYATAVAGWANGGYEEFQAYVGKYGEVTAQAAEDAAKQAEMKRAVLAASGESLAEGYGEGMEDSDAPAAAGESMAEDTAEGITRNQGEVTGAAQSMMQRAKSAAGRINTYSVGYNFSAGVARGISAGANQAVNAASAMVGKAVAAAKAKADIHSPSRVARDEIGKMIGEGMAEGEIDSIPQVEGAAGDVAQAAIRALAARKGQLQSMVGSLLELENAAEAERDYEDHAYRLQSLRKKYAEAELEDRADILKDIQDEEDSWAQKQLRARRETYEQALSDLEDYAEAAVKVWKDGLSELLELGEYNVFLQEKHGEAAAVIVETYRQMQDALHQQAEEARAMGLSDTDEYIRSLSKKWWGYRDQIIKTMKEAASETQTVLQHQVMLLEKNGGSRGEIVKAYRQMQAELHKTAEEYREMGLSETSREIMDLQSQWWGYEETADKILDTIYNEAMDKLSTLVQSFQSAFDAVEKKQETLRDHLGSFGDLFTYRDEDRGIIELGNLDEQAQAIEELGDALDQLRDRGVDEELLGQIAAMDHKEAWNFAQGLLKLSDEGFESYMDGWQRKQQAAAKVAERFYSGEAAALKREFTPQFVALGEELGQEGELLGQRLSEGIVAGLSALDGPLRQAVGEAIAQAEQGAGILTAAPHQANAAGSIAGELTNAMHAQAAETNTLLQSISGALQQGGQMVVYLDATKVAEAELEPLGRVAAARGTPIFQTL